MVILLEEVQQMEEKDNHTMDKNQDEAINEQDIEIIEPETDEKKVESEETEQQEAKEHTEKDSDETNLEILKNEVNQLKNDKKTIEEKMLRAQAEFDNFKKRTLKEKEAIHKYKSQDIASDILPALDNFERALQADTVEANESFVEGVSMVYRQLIEALNSHGVKAIEAVDNEFDPNLHHAVMQVEDVDKDSNIVTEELQKGYMLKDRVIRPAMVKVNK